MPSTQSFFREVWAHSALTATQTLSTRTQFWKKPSSIAQAGKHLGVRGCPAKNLATDESLNAILPARTRPFARPALGVFKHEAAAIDPLNQHAFLTEDVPDGRFYRFVPDQLIEGRADLNAGTLQVAQVAPNGRVQWHDLDDPLAEKVPTRMQVAQSTPFNGGEGIWYHAAHIYFTTKGDNRVWDYDVINQAVDVIYDRAAHRKPQFSAGSTT